ncbi:MAG: tryptophan synthase subunit alpha [Rickettsiales bacterium]|jgi:tryptophan synthase alpha chain|nr:tryptophan synthase subunit alpha [Rickettsiales bacterium]
MTNKIAQTFAKIKSEKRAGLVSFIMAADPDLESTINIIDNLVTSGTDILEIGMPFSDPVADGVVIQESGKRALKTGVTLNQILKLVVKLRNKYSELPIILMGYFNPIHKFGVEKFCKEAEKVGVTGIIIVDLPMEERLPYDHIFSKYNINFINLLSPNTNEDRLKEIVKDAKGFVYYVSVNATTGSQEPVVSEIKAKLKIIRKYTELPIAVGFGIKNKKQAAAIAKFADFIVVGSQYIKILQDEDNNSYLNLRNFNQELKKSL